MESTGNESKRRLSTLAAFTLSLGLAIGWGSFIITNSSYLMEAGPIGSVLGLLVGMLIMIVIAYNYHVMINKYPENGGLYTFIKNTFGAGHAFLASWFAILTYAAILWANLSSIALFSRYLLGGVFQFGFSYNLFGYDVYFGEILLSLLVLLVFGSATLFKRKILSVLSITMTLFFLGAIVFVAIYALAAHPATITYSPGFADNGKSEFYQMISVISMSPWAYIGFEGISHMSERYNFPHKKVFRILVLSVIAATVVYASLCFIGVSAFPEGASSWKEYIANRESYSGLDAIPSFFVAKYYLGTFGVILFGIALFFIVVTSVIGNILVLGNLMASMAKDGVIPKVFAKENRYGAPYVAILLIIGVSFLMLFVGRAALGWIVDVNTITGTIIYTYVSACAFSLARKHRNVKSIIFGVGGIIFGIAFGLMLIVPNVLAQFTIAQESFFIFSIWGLIGFTYYYFLLRKDKHGNYGHSSIVWIGCGALILFSSLVWTEQIVVINNEKLAKDIEALFRDGVATTEAINALEDNATRNIIIASFVFAMMVILTQIVIFLVVAYVRKKEIYSRRQLNIAEDMVNKDPLTGVKSKHAYMKYEHHYSSLIGAGGQIEFAIALCDVNDLKSINDRLGHDAGDQLVKDAASLVCSTFKHSPVFRVGGDEFVVLLEGEDFINREALYNEMYQIVERNSHGTGLVVSVGMKAYVHGEDASFNDLFRKADELMYENKAKLKANRPAGFSIR